MSLKSATEFIEKANHNSALKAKVEATGKEFFEHMRATAEAEGFEFNKAELFNAIRAKFAGTHEVTSDIEANCIVVVV